MATFPEFNGFDDPRPTLIAFVRGLEDFLGEIVETGRDPLGEPLFWPELYEEMRPAWNEVREHFPRVIRRLEDISDGQIFEHGLGGRQLRFKLAVIGFFHARYLSVGKGMLKKIIDILDDLLDSILDAIGAGGAIKEFKDFVEDSIED
jgi:hypothetical protein